MDTSAIQLKHLLVRAERPALPADVLASFLAAAAFVIEAQFGDWDRSPVVASSLEIITLARVPGSPD